MGKINTTQGGGQGAELEIQDIPVGERRFKVSEEEIEQIKEQIKGCRPADYNSDSGDSVDSEEKSIHRNYETLPECVQRRIEALRKIQEGIVKSDVEFYESVFQLEIQYEKRRQDLFEKRLKIINGEHEPADEECYHPALNESQNRSKMEFDCSYPDYEDNVKGIPGFWLTVLNNSLDVNKYIHEHDEPLLEHLQDIKLKLQEAPTGYTLEFVFSDNIYFSNKVLTKYYELNYKPNKDYPLTYDGSETISCKGCEINWKGKNITLNPKNYIDDLQTKYEDYLGKSFFEFFNPPVTPEDESSETYQDIYNILLLDYDLGNTFKDRIIPKATLYFTGEEFDTDINEYEEEEEEEDGKVDDEEEEKKEVEEKDGEEVEKNVEKDVEDENKNITTFENKNIA